MTTSESPADRPAPVVVGTFRGSRSIGEIVRFLLVSLLNTGFGYAVYAGGYLAGLSPSLALAFAYCLGTLFNFMTNGRIVFQSLRLKALPRFVALAAGTFVTNAIGLNAIISLGVEPLPAQLMMLCLMLPVTYLVSKLLIFTRAPMATEAN